MELLKPTNDYVFKDDGPFHEIVRLRRDYDFYW